MTEPRRQMLTELADITRRLGGRMPTPLVAGDEGDRAVVNENYEHDLAARERMQARRRSLIAALERIDAGVWGKCSLCSEAIGGARLTAIPEVEFCITCARSIERDAARESRTRTIHDEEE